MNRCAFISGHRDLTDDEFKKHYIPQIDESLKDNVRFVVCDYNGADEIAQKYLKERNAKHVVIFHMLENPKVNFGFPTIGNFQSDDERDSAATDSSDFDIAWVRDGKIGSGTHQNLLRRLNPAGTYVKHIVSKKKNAKKIRTQNRYKRKRK